MMQIIFLGLIVTLKLVSGDCIIGKLNVNNFDYTKVTGTWYFLLHSNNTIEDNLECVVGTHGIPQGNIGLTSLRAYDISAKRYITLYGNVTNWTNTSVDEYFQGLSIWSGRYYVVATDYDNYVILKMCSFVSNQLHIYVAYRSNRPDKATLNRVKKELRESNIGIRQLVNWPADNCQQA